MEKLFKFIKPVQLGNNIHSRDSRCNCFSKSRTTKSSKDAYPKNIATDSSQKGMVQMQYSRRKFCWHFFFHNKSNEMIDNTFQIEQQILYILTILICCEEHSSEKSAWR